MKVFISQPMNGKSDEEIRIQRDYLGMLIRMEFGSDVEILDSFFMDYNPENGNIPLKYLSKSIEILADADLAVFSEGFSEARGCVIELYCADQYGIRIMHQKELEVKQKE